jgi:hypothetical protein
MKLSSDSSRTFRHDGSDTIFMSTRRVSISTVWLRQETAITLSNTGGGGLSGGLTINAVNCGTSVNGWKTDSRYVIIMIGSVYEIGVRVKRIPHVRIP